MQYTERQKVERETFNSLVHEKWDAKDLFVSKEKPPFADYSGDLWDGASKLFGDLQNKKVLEIGCGSGEVSVWFAKNGAQVSGADVSDESIKIAEHRSAENFTDNQIKFYACPAEHLPFADKFFDLIFVNVSLHHMELESALKEFSRVLKPGGSFIAIEPMAFSETIQRMRASELFTLLYPIRQETTTERILTENDLELISLYIGAMNYEPYRIFSPFVYKIKPLFNFLATIFFSGEKDFETRKQKMNRSLQ